MPVSPFAVVIILVALGFVLVYVQLGILVIAFHKLGLTPGQALALLLTALAGSLVNLPLVKVKGIPPDEVELPRQIRLGLLRLPPYHGITLIAVNVGGCVVPVCFSFYLLSHSALELSQTLAGIALVTGVSFAASRPMPGIGIGMPVFVGPLAAALVGIVLGGEESAALAYIAGSLGVLLGADVLRINDVRHIGAAVASVGGAGTFDGIFLTGIVAALLA